MVTFLEAVALTVLPNVLYYRVVIGRRLVLAQDALLYLYLENVRAPRAST